MSDTDTPIIEDTPLRLARAAAIAFPGGGMTAKGLRREAQRGRLVIERIAGKDYTTLRDIAEMRKLCRLAPKRQFEPLGRAPRHDATLSEQALREAQRRLDAAINGPIDLKDRLTGKWAREDATNKARRMSKRERDLLRECYRERGKKFHLDHCWRRTIVWLVLHGFLNSEGYGNGAKRLYSITPAGEAEWLRIPEGTAK